MLSITTEKFRKQMAMCDHTAGPTVTAGPGEGGREGKKKGEGRLQSC